VPGNADHELTYDDLLRIVELVKASERYARFHLKLGEFEIELRREPAGRRETASVTGLPTASASPE
jgi:acetyl-CoA carboxylase biotin carboxyl carrier protein